jgi:hypothetical protein
MASIGTQYEECRKNLEELCKWYDEHPGDRNEATTRLQLLIASFSIVSGGIVLMV